MSPQRKMRNSPKSPSARTNSPVKGLVSPSSHSATVINRITTQPSTRHQSKRSSQRNSGRISPGNQHTKLWPNGERHRKSPIGSSRMLIGFNSSK
ncbi:hypothetical protein POPTR_019G039401v4 [Populus trichocarpa]|uniref:Uncharacterized protein n=1 Tax=Populus trichocarpa TaxID=3694 RepID=A0ACC0RK17_POPTR|nr:hypothetical protein BDE02_19G040500 [Populus trichocarpa]KAI9377242.1 hypothetical protein POPTR_019G039401v4 [Populus trichocarpa]